MNIYKFYIPWDFDMLVDGVTGLIGSIGTIFNVGMWIFLFVAAILFIRSLIG